MGLALKKVEVGQKVVRAAAALKAGDELQQDAVEPIDPNHSNEAAMLMCSVCILLLVCIMLKYILFF